LPDEGAWLVRVEARPDERQLVSLAAAFALPDGHDKSGAPCAARRYPEPDVTFTTSDGRLVRAAAPRDACLAPLPPVTTAFESVLARPDAVVVKLKQQPK